MKKYTQIKISLDNPNIRTLAQETTIVKSSPKVRDRLRAAFSTLGLLCAPLTLLSLIGTMNNGTALTSSAFDTVVLWLTDLAHSTFTLMLALIVLVIAGWQIAHGGGYKMLGLVLAVLAIMILGPTFLTTMATAMLPS